MKGTREQTSKYQRKERNIDFQMAASEMEEPKPVCVHQGSDTATKRADWIGEWFWKASDKGERPVAEIHRQRAGSRVP